MKKYVIGVVLYLSLCLSSAWGAETVMVFAAASTINAVTDIGRLFEEKILGSFASSFASSSTLARQIDRGAPADIYISANPKWMNYLDKKKLIEPGMRVYLLGSRLVQIAPVDSPLGHVNPEAGVALEKLLGDGRLAMGDPDHVPAGIYGKQALTTLGLWKKLEFRLARTKDVRAALALVARGETPLGIVYASDAAISKRVRVVGMFPEETHSPIIYPAAVVAGKNTSTARLFFHFLRSPDAEIHFSSNTGFRCSHDFSSDTPRGGSPAPQPLDFGLGGFLQPAPGHSYGLGPGPQAVSRQNIHRRAGSPAAGFAAGGHRLSAAFVHGPPGIFGPMAL